MTAWVEDIPKDDTDWRQIVLSAKQPNGANVRLSPLVLSNNIAGTILHDSINGSIKGIANKRYVHSDDKYTWLPCHIFGSGIDEETQVWIAEEAYVINFGGFINIPPNDEAELFYDLKWDGMPTLHAPQDVKDKVAEALRWLADIISQSEGTV